ncbi:hypothetical protein [Bifidobacterium biavatii]|uniref:Uncharacterized protein n=1 Tax=Bifidobacterium biavatii DSM 23969 TaxID=1437608 RepID=A0A086ZNG8_9BIFI|nr:hypothetical protein [Bifidobacterium biavatii]KFI48068.1 hypothetical protein BBIA_0203 [Bifidobacterium biavatii DSM 23969]
MTENRRNTNDTQDQTAAQDSRDMQGDMRGVGITETQADAIGTLSGGIAYRGKSRVATLLALPADRKWPYFRDQLLARTLAVAAAVVIVVYLAVQVLTPVAAPQLTVAVVRGALNDQDATSLQAQVAQSLKLPEGREGGVTIDAGYDLTDNNSLTKLQTRLSANEIDMIVAPASDFAKLAGFGYFQPITKALTEKQRSTLKDAFASFRGYDDSGDTDIDYDGSGKGASEQYGLKLAGAKDWDALGSADEDALAGVIVDTKNDGNAQRFIDYLFW